MVKTRASMSDEEAKRDGGVWAGEAVLISRAVRWRAGREEQSHDMLQSIPVYSERPAIGPDRDDSPDILARVCATNSR